MNNVSDTSSSAFSYKTLDELVEACVKFYHSRVEKSDDKPEVHRRREQLAGWVRKFHEECGTLSPRVEESIDNLRNGSCIFLMTAHQPNLFPYSGVLRKATLNHVLAEKLSERLKLRVVCFFGLADQDFTDDRWVRSALLPDAERRDGVLELHYDMPEKLMLNRVAKPSGKTLDGWRADVEDWIGRKICSVVRDCRLFGLSFSNEDLGLSKNFEDFWSIVQESYDSAGTYADFNSFLMSRIVDEVWGYDTIFARFSECQRIFEDEFCFLLSRFDEYSRCVKEAMVSTGRSEGGVFEEEYETVPFWYHCSCGSKARLKAERRDRSLIGYGQCVRCGKEYRLDLGSQEKPRVSEIMSSISARSLSVPLVFLRGLGVCCYVGGVGGTEYLKQAEHVAKGLDMIFPPVVVWRPRDVYFGVGQVDGLMVFRKISGTFDFSRYPRVKAELEEKVADVRSRIDELELQKNKLCAGSDGNKGERIQNVKAVSTKQNEVRKKAGFPLLMRNVKLLENVAAIMNMYPCIVDYAVNIGLEETSEQWIRFLHRDGSLSTNIGLETQFEDIASCVRPESSRE